MNKAVKVGIIAGVVIAVVVGGGAAAVYMLVGEIEDQMGINMSDEELDELRTDASYEDLLADPETYAGKTVQKTGEILSVEPIMFGDLAYLVHSDGEYYLLYDPNASPDAVGYISFYGTVAGKHSVQVSGQEIDAVMLNAEKIMLSESPLN